MLRLEKEKHPHILSGGFRVPERLRARGSGCAGVRVKLCWGVLRVSVRAYHM